MNRIEALANKKPITSTQKDHKTKKNSSTFCALVLYENTYRMPLLFDYGSQGEQTCKLHLKRTDHSNKLIYLPISVRKCTSYGYRVQYEWFLKKIEVFSRSGFWQF